MIRKSPMHDTGTPPGQLVARPPRYLKDIITRIQGEEKGDGCCHKTVVTRCEECPYKGQEQQQATVPSTNSEKRLERLTGALTRLCEESEALAKGEDGEQFRAMVLTKQIRRILRECS